MSKASDVLLNKHEELINRKEYKEDAVERLLEVGEQKSYEFILDLIEQGYFSDLDSLERHLINCISMKDRGFGDKLKDK